jgi:lysophospholipase L1-like esterase
LERGFHLVYFDVAELYGNSEAIRIWNKFYDLMQRAGLGKKASLEGMSRGGVYIYNWALANPDKVACIYADAPVLDLKSWPGGKGKGPGSSYDWEIFKKDYQLDEKSAAQFSNSPLNNAAKIAKLGIPLLHVVGDDDEVVPVEENSGPFEKAIKNNGGQIRVIHKPGVKHHPHSLANPSPIVDFILKANRLKTNFAVMPMPGTEYRSGAGWIEGKDWWAQSDNIDSLLMSSKNPDILFLGNSITQGIGGRRSYVTYKPGLSIFDSVFSKYRWETAGISGDRTQNILWRVMNGKYALSKPRLIVLTIGVNNFNEDDSPAEIVDGIIAILKYLRTELPASKIIVSGLLPTGIQKNSERRMKHDEIHRLLSKLPAKDFLYYTLTNTFVQPDGSLSLSDYSSDGIHLIEGGYRKWALAIYPVVEKLLK